MTSIANKLINRHLPPSKDFKGQKFGEYTVIKFAGWLPSRSINKKTPYWSCRCSCGRIKDVDQYYLKKATCCISCAAVKSNKTHGKSHLSIHAIWRHNVAKYTTNFHEDWRDPKTGFEKFLEDVGNRPSKFHRFKRINPELPWRPGNVHWVYSYPKIVYYKKMPYTIPDLADVFGIKQATLRCRLKYLSPEDAVSCSIPENAPRAKSKKATTEQE